ncbi:hypothetical protein HYU22_04380 [Candidatus Woesearchaeota archaeon]|nr:hypothetical protein [Candidatus Woesearchaeota archaeon]
MKRIEYVYRELLYQVGEQKKAAFTQLALARLFHISLSTVHQALRPLRHMGAIEIVSRGFRVIDRMKILYHWASVRKVEKDIMYRTRIEKPVRAIESEMPSSIVWGAYSAYKHHYHDIPADYSEVYVYGDVQDKEIRQRYPERSGPPNLLVLRKDPFLERYGKITTKAQTFVDLWNLREWYAKEFVQAILKKEDGWR